MTLAYRLLAYIGLALALLVAGFAAGHHVAYVAGSAKLSALQAQDAQAIADQEAQLAKAQSDALAKQQADEQHIANIQQTYEQDKAHAKAQSDAVIDSLRAGTLRLRSEWRCPSTTSSDMPQAASGRSSTSTAADLRYQGTSDLVRNADDADAEIKALQAIVIQDRE